MVEVRTEIAKFYFQNFIQHTEPYGIFHEEKYATVEDCKTALNTRAKASIFHALKAERLQFSKLGPKSTAPNSGEILPSSLMKFLENSPVKNVVDHELNQFKKSLTQPPQKSIDLATGKIRNSTPEKERPTKIRLPKELTKNTKKVGEDVSSSQDLRSRTRSQKNSKSKPEDLNGADSKIFRVNRIDLKILNPRLLTSFS